MTIRKIDIFHIEIPLLEIFETSFGIIDCRPAIIIKITSSDGLIGFGESSPLYMPISESEIMADSIRVLQKISPHLIGVKINSTKDIQLICSMVPGYPVTKIGIEGAYFHILAQQNGQPLSATFNGNQKVLFVGESIGIKKSLDLIISEVELRVRQKYKRVKIKIKPGHDVLILQQVRSIFPDIAFGVDANSAYSFRDIENLKFLDQFNLLFIEQPFAQNDLQSHSLLQKKITTPICLDESIVDMVSCRKAIEMRACKMINIKPARIGSFSLAKDIHDYCLEHHISLFGGGRMETGIGKIINANFYSLSGFTLPADITPPLEYFPEDIIVPSLAVQQGELHLSSLSGLGVEIDEYVIKKYLKEHMLFV